MSKKLSALWASLSWSFAGLRARHGDRRLWITAWAVVTALIVVSMSTLTIGEMIHLSAHQATHQTVQATPTALPALPHAGIGALALSASSEVLAWVACTGPGSTCTGTTVRSFHPTGPIALIWVCQQTTSNQLPSGVIGVTVLGPAGKAVSQLTAYCPTPTGSQATSGLVIENYPPSNYVLTIARASAPTWFVLVVQVHA